MSMQYVLAPESVPAYYGGYEDVVIKQTTGGSIMEYLGNLFIDIAAGGNTEFEAWLSFGFILSTLVFTVFMLHVLFNCVYFFIEDERINFKTINGWQIDDLEDVGKFALICLFLVLICGGILSAIVLPIVYYNYWVLLAIAATVASLFGLRALRKTQKVLSKHIQNAKAHEEEVDKKDVVRLESSFKNGSSRGRSY